MSALFLRLNWAWRLAMTGLCFALFGLGGLLLSAIAFNLLLIIVRDKTRRRRMARRSIAASFRLFLTITKWLGVLDYQIEGQVILAKEQRCLVVANHPTLIDYVLLASVMPETDCLVKSALLKNPFLCGVVRAADYLINSQGNTLLAECQQRLDQGNTILIFPEGTRTQPGEAMTLQRGAANIAVRCRSDLRVVSIRCSERMLDKKSKWYNVPPSKPVFTVSVRERIKIDSLCDVHLQEPALAARRLNQHLLIKLQTDNSSFPGIHDASALS